MPGDCAGGGDCVEWCLGGGGGGAAPGGEGGVWVVGGWGGGGGRWRLRGRG